ncbi:Fatty acid oxidation complex subunit alpha [Actinomortierella ambigua]|nr:Fatty acid oxidation complex subunit alpha [Actinomortierella ambigua]
MAPPNTVDAGLVHRQVQSSVSKEATPKYERDYVVPEFTIKELREAIPAHLFERSAIKSLSHVAIDLTYAALLFLAAMQIDKVESPLIRWGLLWPAYWIAQGVVCTGIWVLAHECGHQAFSPSKTLNNTVGWILHSALLVPYHSWRISHSKHHKATGHMTKDQVFVPKTRSQVGLPPKKTDDHDHDHDGLDEEAPIVTLFYMVVQFLFGWPAYLIVNASGQDYGQWTSHFHTWSPIFEPRNFNDVVLSDAGVLLTLGGLYFMSAKYTFLAVVKYYGIPYLFVNFWLVLITYLQHTDPKLPHYREGVWNFQRGALCTVDRSFGILDYFFHHITDTHVAHHLFSQMPFYNAEEATRHLKKVLGEYYIWDDTPIAVACWRSFRECRFVEDEGDVLFFKK